MSDLIEALKALLPTPEEQEKRDLASDERIRAILLDNPDNFKIVKLKDLK